MAYEWICISLQQSISYITNLAGRLSCKRRQLENSLYRKKWGDSLLSVFGNTRPSWYPLLVERIYIQDYIHIHKGLELQWNCDRNKASESSIYSNPHLNENSFHLIYNFLSLSLSWLIKFDIQSAIEGDTERIKSFDVKIFSSYYFVFS